MIDHIVRDIEALEALYGEVNEVSALKEIDYLHPAYAAFIKASPFAVLASTGPDGLDASPRGDPPGFVEILDEKTLLLADRRGNNRIDSLRNVLSDPRIALLFLVPGIGESAARQRASRDFHRAGTAGALYAESEAAAHGACRSRRQCVFPMLARAHPLRVVEPRKKLPREALPSTGEMLQAVTRDKVDARTYDAELPARLKTTFCTDAVAGNRPSPIVAGLMCRCPRCGQGRLFAGFLSLAARCTVCGLDFAFADSGDGPAVFVIFLVSPIVVVLAVILEALAHPAPYVHLIVWLPHRDPRLALLRPFKATMVALQFAHGAREGRLK